MPESIEGFCKHFSDKKPALLLGAGASISSGAPSGAQLSKQLAESIDKGIDYNKHELATLAEILEIKHGRRAVIEAVKGVIHPLEPHGGLSVIPSYPWRSIYTTNYDCLIEKAYSKNRIPIQVLKSDLDYPSIENVNGVLLFKMHGCITQDRCYGDHASIIITESDYYKPSTYREKLYNRMELDVLASGLIVIGHSLADKHFSDLLRNVAEIQKKGGYFKKIGIISFTPDEDKALLYEAQGMMVSFGGIDEFMDGLLNNYQIGPTHVPVSADLIFALPANLVPSTLVVEQEVQRIPSAERVFNGRPANYADIEAGYTFARNVESLLEAKFSSGARVAVVTGVAGVGKTTTMRRFLLNRHKCGDFCWEHKEGLSLRVDHWLTVDAMLRAKSIRGYLLIDDITEHQRDANHLLDKLPSITDTYGLCILGTAQTSQWVPRQKTRRFYSDGHLIELTSLDPDEIDRLVRHANETTDIRALVTADFRRLDFEQQRRNVRSKAASDMFLAMKMLFANDTFDEIVLQEYADIEDQNLRDIYKLVSGLEAAGFIVHRQLVLNLIGLSASYVAPYLESLRGLIEESDSNSSEGIFIWRTRHERVAEVISQYKFGTEIEYFELLRKVIAQINPAVSIERRFFSDVCNRYQGIRRISDPIKRIELYYMLIDVDPTCRVPRHRIIREYLDIGEVGKASAALTEAIDKVGIEPPLQRYKALILLARANKGKANLMEEDIRTLYRKAYEEADTGIKKYKDNKHQYVTFDDVAREYYYYCYDHSWLQESARRLRKAYELTLDSEVHSKAQDTERLLLRLGVPLT